MVACTDDKLSEQGETCTKSSDCKGSLRCINSTCIYVDGGSLQKHDGSAKSCATLLAHLRTLIVSGNSSMDKPTVSYGKTHHDIIVEMKGKNCSLSGAYIGKAPFLCNNGSPACPINYTCDSNKQCVVQ